MPKKIFPINTNQTHLFQFLGDGFDFDAYMGHGQSTGHLVATTQLSHLGEITAYMLDFSTDAPALMSTWCVDDDLFLIHI